MQKEKVNKPHNFYYNSSTITLYDLILFSPNQQVMV